MVMKKWLLVVLHKNKQLDLWLEYALGVWSYGSRGKLMFDFDKSVI